MAKNSKNLQRVQDMLDGSYQGKIQVGQYNPADKVRKVGDVWTDSDGKTWEQKEGYRSSVKRTPDIGLFPYQCKDCKKNCGSLKVDKDTWKRYDRCYHCQMDFEHDLQSFKNRIGENGNKWQFWVRLQELNRWIAGRKELEQWIEDEHKLKNKKIYDMSVVNAMANSNIDASIKVNKKLTK
tara:strand:+ start:95 stop:637 length:543 start_codon:yes stop_codon:yes gene_type:complete